MSNAVKIPNTYPGENKQVTKYMFASSSSLWLRMLEQRVREHAAFSVLAVIIWNQPKSEMSLFLALWLAIHFQYC